MIVVDWLQLSQRINHDHGTAGVLYRPGLLLCPKYASSVVSILKQPA